MIPFSTTSLPEPAACIVRNLIDRHGRERPAETFVAFSSGESDWTWGEILDEVRKTAALLRRLGVRQGDHVAMWLPNGRAAMRAWFAVNYLGAVIVPLNQAYRGRLLEHAITLSDATIMFAHPDLVARLEDVELAALTTLLVDGGGVTPPRGLQVIDPAQAGAPEDLALKRPPQPWDVAAIIFTSGTTGPSKGVIVTYAQMYFSAVHQTVPIGPGDRALLHSPLFHVAGMGAVYRAMVSGGSVGLLDRFSTPTFWADVRRVGATRATMMGSMATFLLSQPISEDERLTPLKTVIIAPVSPDTVALARRADMTWFTTFNMSETSFPVISELRPEKVGTCGKPRAGVEARVVDEHDIEVAPGEIGELILRTDIPWSLTPGYYKNPEATARAWRNGWFHTGDAFRVDGDGDFLFIDRLKDAIRRRGENISSYEVEVEVCAHPAVEDAAAVAVPSEYGEDEVLVVIELRKDAALSPEDLLRFLQPRMAHFMLPRYVRIVGALPRTPTYKVQKHLLRSEGITSDAWDREAAGFIVSRDRIGS